jgi:anti-anti-sigma factor
MELNLETFLHAGQTGLRLVGRLNGATALPLEQWLQHHGEPSPAVWDISALHYVSSAGLRVLLAHEKRRRKLGATPTLLVGLQPAVREVLVITGLGDFWPQLAVLPAAGPVPTTVSGNGSADDNSGAQPVFATSGAVVADAWACSTGTTATNGNDGTTGPTGNDGTLVRWQQAAGIAASLTQLRVAFGCGGLGARRATAAAQPVDFFHLPGVLALRHADGESDTLLVANPAERFVRLEEAWAFAGSPAGLLQLRVALAPAALVAAIGQVLPGPWYGVLAAAPVGEGACLSLSVLPPAATGEPAVGCSLPVTGLDFAELAAVTSLDTVLELLAAVVGEGLAPGLVTDYPAGTWLWVWAATAPIPAAVHGLTIDAPEADDDTELLVRTLYADCKHVQLARLAGGFSAATWLVASSDAAGRQHLPTVLKVGPPAMMNRENTAHEKYVRPFILNNASVALGNAKQGDSVGLRYNFVGITGDTQGLQTLMRRWNAGEGDAVTTLFGQLARNTLRPWYGQARRQPTRLYANHTPLHLFTGLLGVARDFLPHDLQQRRLFCAPLGRELPNPWWFLEHRWSRLHDYTIDCPVGITHGDLNLNNVLSDERGNLYVIDFSETRERSIASDFARNEPVFLLEQATLESDEDEARFLRDVECCYARPVGAGSLLPLFPETLETVDASRLAFLREQRQLASDYLGADAPLQAWLLPLLEWTLPITLFGNRPERMRRTATWVAALQLELLQTVAQEAAEDFA